MNSQIDLLELFNEEKYQKWLNSKNITWIQVTPEDCIRWQLDNELASAKRIRTPGSQVEYVRYRDGYFEAREEGADWHPYDNEISNPGYQFYNYFIPEVKR